MSIPVSLLRAWVASGQPLPVLGLWGQAHLEGQGLHAPMEPGETGVKQGGAAPSDPADPQG